MATIFIETIPIANSFQLNRTLYIGYAASKDWLEEYSFDDRLRAAIYNFGVAAKELIKQDYSHKQIAIISDNDGRDRKFDGEHNTLYSLLYPYNDLESRKYASLYQDYSAWLHRAKELIIEGKINVGLIEAGGDLIDRWYKGDTVKELNKKAVNYYHSQKLGWIK